MRRTLAIQGTIKFSRLLVVSCSLLATGALAQVRPPSLLIQTISENALQLHVQYLASPQLKGRGNASPGPAAAASYIEAEFSAAGLPIFLTAWEVAFRKDKLSVDPSMN